jgi:hypothetical protein
MKLRMEFQVETTNEEDVKVLDTVKDLKKKRMFMPTLRDALNLIMDLRGGSLVVLFELFPWIQEQMQTGQVTAPKPPSPQLPPDTTELAKEIAAQIILQGGTEGYTMQSNPPPQPQPSSGIKSLTNKSLAMPTFEDDDEPTVIINASAKPTGDNFLSGLMGLQ